jgi:hypothetical protein
MTGSNMQIIGLYMLIFIFSVANSRQWVLNRMVNTALNECANNFFIHQILIHRSLFKLLYFSLLKILNDIFRADLYKNKSDKNHIL